MNIMLLAMSTYPYSKEIANYTALSVTGEKYSYYSQLEPGCKKDQWPLARVIHITPDPNQHLSPKMQLKQKGDPYEKQRDNFI